MSVYPSPLFLAPAALATAFYTQTGTQAIRILTIGLITDYFVQQTAVILIFVAAAISTTISQASTTIFNNFDFFSIFGIFQSLLFYLAISQLCYLKNQKKPSVGAFFLGCALTTLSVTQSLAYISIFFFGRQALVFISLAQCAGPLIIEHLITQNQEFYDNEQFSAGFGVEHNSDGMQLQHGQSFFATLRKRYTVSFGIFYVACGIGMPLLLNLFGNYHPGLFGYLYVAFVSGCCLVLSIVVLWLQKSGRKLRGAEEVDLAKQQTVAGETKTQAEQFVETAAQRLKRELAQFRKFGKRDFFWYIILLALYELANTTFYGTDNLIPLITPVIFAFLSTKCILCDGNSTINIIMLVLATPLTINWPLMGFLHFMMHGLLNASENKPYSVLMLYAAQMACIAFSMVPYKWIFTIVFAVLAIPSQVPILNNSKLGVKIVIFLQSFALDVLLTLPRRYVRNLVVNGFVMLAIVMYSRKFMQTAVGERQASQTVFSIALRVITNTINSFLLVTNTNQVQMEILRVIVAWNGYFNSALSLAIQVLSYFALGDRVSKLKYAFLAPLFICILLIIAFTPLSVIVIDMVLFATGFANIFVLQSSHVLQETTILVYRTLFQNIVPGQYSLQILLWLCRGFSGALVAAAVILIINYSNNSSQSSKQLNNVNTFSQLLFSSFLCLFLGVPSAVAQLGEIEEFSMSSNVVIISVFIIINVLNYVEIDSYATKVLFGIGYAALIAFNIFSKQYSESVVLLVFQILLAFLPQNSFVASYVVGILMLITFIGIKYAAVTISYHSAITVFSVLAVLFLARFSMVKHSALRRIAKKMKIQNVGCKINAHAFRVGDEDVDVFLGLSQEGSQPDQQQNAEQIYEALRPQMYVFIVLSSLILTAWNFYPLINVVLSLCVLLIPVDQRDQSNNITQVAGYIGLLDGFQVNAQNKLRMVQRFVFCLYLLLNVRFLFDFFAYVGLYVSDKEGYGEGFADAMTDLVLYVLQTSLCFIGYVYITAQPYKLFVKLSNLQKNKILIIMTVFAVLIAVFATNQVIKIMPAFLACAITFAAPQSAAAEAGKRVINVESVEI